MQILVFFSLQSGFFEIQGCRNQKCTEWPQSELENLTVKSTLYTLKTHPKGPNFYLFRSTTSRFRDTMSPKLGNAPNDPKLNFNTKLPCIHCVITPEAQILVCFALKKAFFKIAGYRKSEKSQMHRIWPQNYLDHVTVKKYPVYSKYLPLRHKFSSILLYDQPLFKIHGCWKSEISEMYQMISDWLWNPNSQKYLIYNK